MHAVTAFAQELRHIHSHERFVLHKQYGFRGSGMLGHRVVRHFELPRLGIIGREYFKTVSGAFGSSASTVAPALVSANETRSNRRHIRVASRKGIEPLTPGLGNLCSILLSYRDLDINAAAAKTL